MLKSSVSFISVLLLWSCSTSHSIPKLKSFSNNHYSFKYSSNWKTYMDHNNLSISPRRYLTNKSENRYKNFVSLIEYNLNKGQGTSIPELVEHDIDVILSHTYEGDNVRFDSEWKSGDNGKVYVLKISNKDSKRPFEHIKHYYQFKDTIYQLKYTNRTEGKNMFLEEAMIIFDSFKFLD